MFSALNLLVIIFSHRKLHYLNSRHPCSNFAAFFFESSLIPPTAAIARKHLFSICLIFRHGVTSIRIEHALNFGVRNQYRVTCTQLRVGHFNFSQCIRTTWYIQIDVQPKKKNFFFVAFTRLAIFLP